jgi:hypothetical protein
MRQLANQRVDLGARQVLVSIVDERPQGRPSPTATEVMRAGRLLPGWMRGIPGRTRKVMSQVGVGRLVGYHAVVTRLAALAPLTQSGNASRCTVVPAAADTAAERRTVPAGEPAATRQ